MQKAAYWHLTTANALILLSVHMNEYFQLIYLAYTTLVILTIPKSSVATFLILLPLVFYNNLFLFNIPLIVWSVIIGLFSLRGIFYISQNIKVLFTYIFIILLMGSVRGELRFIIELVIKTGSLIAFTAFINTSGESRKNLIELLAWSFVLSAFSAEFFGVIRLQYVGSELVSRASGYIGDPNYFARFGLILLILDRQNREKIRNITFIAVSLVMLMTLSKMSIIVLVILWILRFVSLKSINLPSSLFIVGIMLIISYSGLWQNIANRVSRDFNSKNITSHRVDLQISGLRNWSNSGLSTIMFGVGTSNSIKLTEELGSRQNVLHNAYLTVLVEHGLIAFLVYVFFVLRWIIVAADRWGILLYLFTGLALSGVFFWDQILLYSNIRRNNEKII